MFEELHRVPRNRNLFYSSNKFGSVEQLVAQRTVNPWPMALGVRIPPGPISACNVYATEFLEKELSALQTELEKPLADDKWILCLTFGKYCWFNIKGAGAKKVYNTLLDEKKHTFVFKIDPNQVKDVDKLYKLTLEAIDAEEVL